MSGIFGFFQNFNVDNKIDIEKMQSWHRAYGREGEEVYEGADFGFGCCYEKLSKDAKRSTPVLKKKGQYAVVDALLYNREELIEKCELQEELSDEELLLYYVERFGINALKDVNGDFAGGIYDENDKSLILFRDHMGVRPLFYFASDEFVAFSTDIRGLTSIPQVDASADEEWVYKIIGGYAVMGIENTEFANIFCVRPAGYMKFSFASGKCEMEKNTYWQLGNNKVRLSSEEEYKDKMRELITDSVKRRLNAVSGLIGAELSGGLDSGVIDILINRLGREGVYFSWSLAPEEVPLGEKDERIVIADICEQENITCNYGKMRLDFGEESNMSQSIRQVGIDLKMDEISAFRYALPAYVNILPVCESSQFVNQQGARVVFTGHGGDEGVSHRCNPYEMFYNHEYYHFLRYMWSTTHGQKGRVIKTLKNCYKNLSETRKKLTEPFRNPFGVPELLNADFAGKFDESSMPILRFGFDAKEYVKDGGSRSRLDNVALLGAYSGVRYLIPYLDYRVIDYAVSIPRHMYLKGGKNRYIFREAFKDIMPKTLYSQRYKEDVSWRNVEKDPNWFEEFAKRKADVVSRLDREYWKQYLDFSVIDNWLERGEPSEEERFREENILRPLLMFATLENMVKKSRES